MGPESLLDARVALIAGAAAAVSSERVRHTVGRGIGYGIAGVRKVGGTVVDTGRDIYDSAREVSGGHPDGRSRARTRAAA
jgi:hypothetical protein